MTTKRKKTYIKKFVMFKYRHIHRDTAKLKSIFTSVDDPFDFKAMEEQVEYFFKKHRIGEYYIDELQIYVTGLTPALIVILNHINKNKKKYLFDVTLMHYSVQLDKYIPQRVEREW